MGYERVGGKIYGLREVWGVRLYIKEQTKKTNWAAINFSNQVGHVCLFCSLTATAEVMPTLTATAENQSSPSHEISHYHHMTEFLTCEGALTPRHIVYTPTCRLFCQALIYSVLLVPLPGPRPLKYSCLQTQRKHAFNLMRKHPPQKARTHSFWKLGSHPSRHPVFLTGVGRLGLCAFLFNFWVLSLSFVFTGCCRWLAGSVCLLWIPQRFWRYASFRALFDMVFLTYLHILIQCEHFVQPGSLLFQPSFCSFEAYYKTHQLAHKSQSDIAWIGGFQSFRWFSGHLLTIYRALA